mmetsp:Transcript_9636/g.23621  ORF Transcript_9636/g.23621 Transcript_9636/m.23621 type:complete len:102 (-) Transcript_9636:462-767(-)
MLVTMVLPWFLARSLNTPRRLTAEAESRPEVGSSRRMMDGFVNSSVPMFTRFFSPPEHIMMGLSATFASCRSRRISSTSEVILAFRASLVVFTSEIRSLAV